MNREPTRMYYGRSGEKLDLIIRELCCSPGTLQERLLTACRFNVSALKSEYFPIGLQEEVTSIKELLATDSSDPDGTVAGNIRNMNQEEAEHLANRLITLFASFQRNQ